MSAATSPHGSPTDKRARRAVERGERYELLQHVEGLLEPLMVVLGLGFLVLLFLDFGFIALSQTHAVWVDRGLVALWVVFVAEFALRFVIAPSKWDFLRHNWLGAVSLALPFLRPIRALRAVRAVRSLSLVRLLGGVNRGMRALRRVTAGHNFAYVAALSVMVALAGAVGAWYFDAGNADAPIQSFGDALWWAATLVTTMNSEKYVVSNEARVIAILLRLYALSVFGYVTASIAAYFVGQQAQPAASDGDALTEQLAGLRREVARLREEMDGRERAG